MIQTRESRSAGESKAALNLEDTVSVAAASANVPVDPAYLQHIAHPAEWEAAFMFNRAVIRALCGYKAHESRWPTGTLRRNYPACPTCLEAQAAQRRRAA